MIRLVAWSLLAVVGAFLLEVLAQAVFELSIGAIGYAVLTPVRRIYPEWEPHEFVLMISGLLAISVVGLGIWAGFRAFR